MIAVNSFYDRKSHCTSAFLHKLICFFSFEVMGLDLPLIELAHLSFGSLHFAVVFTSLLALSSDLNTSLSPHIFQNICLIFNSLNSSWDIFIGLILYFFFPFAVVQLVSLLFT